MSGRELQQQSVTPLWAVNALSFLASVGTGVVWNGVPFIAENEYHWTSQQTLSLSGVIGVLYVLGALMAGPAIRAIESVLSPRSALVFILSVEAIVCTGPYFSRADSMLWLVAGVNSVLSSWLWPIVESYVTAGRHGNRMRSAIGWWNLCWTSATALSLVMISPFMKEQPRLVIVAIGGLNALAVGVLYWFRSSPGEHDHEMSAASVQQEYPLLLQAARMLLPLSYVLNSAMGPLLPYLFEALNVEPTHRPAAASTWMWVRIAAMALMWQLGFWHGRWGTLVIGAVGMLGGFAMVVTAPSAGMAIAGLGVFGAGMGVIYYAALYYAMSVGKAEVDAGGTHEALIGVGYALGPLAGWLGLHTPDVVKSWTGLKIGPGIGVVCVVWLFVGVGLLGVIRPYRKARSLRAARASA